MIYRKFQDLSLSALGFGAMRLPVIDGDDGNIDVATTAEMVAYAMEHGINYYDTAWGYHGEQSEVVMGKLLNQYPRNSFYLATKFPGYDLSNMGKVEEIFEEQLRKCGVEYFDFYLYHNVCELNIKAYLDEKNGILPYLLAQKEAGRIRHLGFSAHGGYEVIKRFLDACGEKMEFGQLQLNYLDWDFQDSKAKLELLEARGVPVLAMEPLRGGSLAKLSEEHAARLGEMRPGETVPAWAFRFLQSFPNVAVTLSGMSNMEQLKANILTYGEEKPLSGPEFDLLQDIAKSLVEGIVVPCTACRYCTSHCPQHLDIPNLLSLYNEHSFTGGGFIAPMALAAVSEEKQPVACIACGNCEAVCPQQIKIADAMADFTRRLGA